MEPGWRTRGGSVARGVAARPSYDRAALNRRHGALVAGVTRSVAIICAIASAILAVYCGTLVYAAATFAHDSLPGPEVLSLVAVAVALAAMLCGGLAHVLWKVGKRAAVPATARENSSPER